MADKPSSRKPRESKSDDSSSYINEKGERHFSFGKSGKTRDDGDFIPEKKPAYKGKSDGRFDKPERASEGRKPYVKRDSEDKPAFKRGNGDDKPYRKAKDDSAGFGAKRTPYKDKPSDDKPYRKSKDDNAGFGAKRGPYKDRSTEDKPFRKGKFEGSDSGEKPYRKSKSDDAGFGAKRGGYGDDKPYRKPKTEGSGYGEKRGGFSEDKPFRKPKTEGSGYGEKRSFRSGGDEKPSFGGRKPARFEKREDSRASGPFSTRGKAKKYDDLPTDGEWLDPAEFSAELGKARKPSRGKNSEAGYRPDFIPRDDKPRRPRVKKETLEDKDGKIRLNKYIANAGICSRREADDLIIGGAIRVNGQIVTQLGYRVDPTDKVQYGDQTLSRETKRYLLLNKPKDYITTASDPEGRKTVMELVSDACRERLYPVGRLDRATTGLLLMTNDGELAKKLMHPSHNVRKVYHVVLNKNLQAVDLKKITEGIVLEDGKAEVDEIAWASSDNKKEVGVVLHSGKNRIVRRIFEHLGYEVVKLDRTGFAGLTKKNLPRGKFRFLSDKEVSLLHMM